MLFLLKQTKFLLSQRKAQVLLPSILLVPLFVLVVYLLYDLANLSMSKVQNQFALDNAAYTQVSSLSTYLNAMAMINGPSYYRVMITFDNDTVDFAGSNSSGYEEKASVFDLFYRSGFFPSLGPNHEKGVNHGKPKAESTDWDFQFFPGNGDNSPRDRYPLTMDESFGSEENYHGQYTGQKDWMVPIPKKPEGPVPIMSWDIVTHYKWNQESLIRYMTEVLKYSFYQGSIYEMHNYMVRSNTKNAFFFREGYSANTKSCKPSECAKQSARMLAPLLDINTVPYEAEEVLLFFSDYSNDQWQNGGRAYIMKASELAAGKNLYIFNHFDNASLNKMKRWERGITLKQSFKTPSNFFKKNLDQKYKPFTRVTVSLACPRRGNNCVWPNPLPKYNVILRP